MHLAASSRALSAARELERAAPLPTSKCMFAQTLSMAPLNSTMGLKSYAGGGRGGGGAFQDSRHPSWLIKSGSSWAA
jgi:hypothetical protein